MDETLLFIDSGFLSKLSKSFGNGNYLKYDLVSFANVLANKERLNCKEIFYYTASPFQGNPPTKEEEEEKEGYDKFIKKLLEKNIQIREGRCQRLKIDNNFQYKQKAVDVFLAMDLTNIPLNYPKIKKIILISSDSDFVPVIQNLAAKGVKTILYTFYSRERNTNFSRSNELIKSVYKYKIIKKEDFIKSKFK